MPTTDIHFITRLMAKNCPIWGDRNQTPPNGCSGRKCGFLVVDPDTGFIFGCSMRRLDSTDSRLLNVQLEAIDELVTEYTRKLENLKAKRKAIAAAIVQDGKRIKPMEDSPDPEDLYYKAKRIIEEKTAR